MCAYRSVLMGVLVLAALLGASPAFASDAKDNAALWYWVAFDLLPESDEDFEWVMDEWQTIPADELPGWVIEQDSLWFRYFYRAAGKQQCVWAVDVQNDGLDALLPHLSQCRKLARLGLARVRYHFNQGRINEAMDGLIAVMSMGKHCSEGCSFVGVRVGVSIENMAMEILAANVWRLQERQLVDLKDRLANLPHDYKLVDVVDMERGIIEWWVNLANDRDMGAVCQHLDMIVPRITDEVIASGGGTVEGFVGMAEDCHLWFDRLKEYFKVPASRIGEEWDRLERDIQDSGNPMVGLSISGMDRIRLEEFGYQVHRAMVTAMIAHQLGGEEEFAKVVDPYDSMPFDMLESDGEVVVRSRMADVNENRIGLVFKLGE